MNKVILCGRLTADPELRYTTGSNIATCSFTIAVNRNYKNADGGYDADFIPVVVWRGLAEMLAKHLKKGARVAVSGRIQTRSYETNEGSKRYVTEVITDYAEIIDWDGKTAQKPNDDGEPASAGYTEIDDDIPF